MTNRHAHEESLRPNGEIALLALLVAVLATCIAIDKIGEVTVGRPYGLFVLGAMTLFLIQVAATIFGLLLLRWWTRLVDSPPRQHVPDQPTKTS